MMPVRSPCSSLKLIGEILLIFFFREILRDFLPGILLDFMNPLNKQAVLQGVLFTGCKF